ncbi:hypothetical protein MRX96_029974 [Rhipicephalus microplus]
MQHSGRPRATTEEEDRLITAAIVADPFQSAENIREALSLTVSSETVSAAWIYLQPMLNICVDYSGRVNVSPNTRIFTLCEVTLLNALASAHAPCRITSHHVDKPAAIRRPTPQAATSVHGSSALGAFSKMLSPFSFIVQVSAAWIYLQPMLNIYVDYSGSVNVSPNTRIFTLCEVTLPNALESPCRITSHHVDKPAAIRRPTPQAATSVHGSSALGAFSKMLSPFSFIVQVSAAWIYLQPMLNICVDYSDSVNVSPNTRIFTLCEVTLPNALASAHAPCRITSHHVDKPAAIRRPTPQAATSVHGSSALGASSKMLSLFGFIVQVSAAWIYLQPMLNICVDYSGSVNVSPSTRNFTLCEVTLPNSLASAHAPCRITSHHVDKPAAIRRPTPQAATSVHGSSALGASSKMLSLFCFIVQASAAWIYLQPMLNICVDYNGSVNVSPNTRSFTLCEVALPNALESAHAPCRITSHHVDKPAAIRRPTPQAATSVHGSSALGASSKMLSLFGFIVQVSAAWIYLQPMLNICVDYSGSVNVSPSTRNFTLCEVTLPNALASAHAPCRITSHHVDKPAAIRRPTPQAATSVHGSSALGASSKMLSLFGFIVQVSAAWIYLQPMLNICVDYSGSVNVTPNTRIFTLCEVTLPNALASAHAPCRITSHHVDKPAAIRRPTPQAATSVHGSSALGASSKLLSLFCFIVQVSAA